MRGNYPKTKSTSTSKDYMDFNLRVKFSAEVVAFGRTWKDRKEEGKFAEIQRGSGNSRK